MIFFTNLSLLASNLCVLTMTLVSIFTAVSPETIAAVASEAGPSGHLWSQHCPGHQKKRDIFHRKILKLLRIGSASATARKSRPVGGVCNGTTERQLEVMLDSLCIYIYIYVYNICLHLPWIRSSILQDMYLIVSHIKMTSLVSFRVIDHLDPFGQSSCQSSMKCKRSGWGAPCRVAREFFIRMCQNWSLFLTFQWSLSFGKYACIVLGTYHLHSM